MSLREVMPRVFQFLNQLIGEHGLALLVIRRDCHCGTHRSCYQVSVRKPEDAAHPERDGGMVVGEIGDPFTRKTRPEISVS